MSSFTATHTPGAGAPAGRGSGLQLLAELGGWLLAGVVVGAVVGSLAVRANTSLQGSGQALPFVAWVVSGYVPALLLVGAVARLAAALRPGATAVTARARFASALASGLAAFGVFSATQWAIATFTWRNDTHPQNVAAALLVALAAGVVLRFVLASRVGNRLAWPLAAVALLAGVGTTFTSVRLEPPFPHGTTPAARASSAATTPKVMVIGIDGLDWHKLKPLMAAGRLPNFTRLCDGAYQAPLETREPTWSPIIWNTIATGVPKEQHGVIDFTEIEIPGLERAAQRLYPKMLTAPELPPYTGLASAFHWLALRGTLNEVTVSGLQRRAKTFWNILSDNGVKVAVVRWWATWPAEQLDGFVVSDNDPLAKVLALDKTSARVMNESFAHMTWPPELAGKLLATLEPGHGDPRTSREAFEGILADPMLRDLTAEDLAALRDAPGILRWFEVIERGDRFATDSALQLWNEEPVSMCAVYLRAIDNLGHRLWKYTGVVDRAYEYTDGLLGELLDAAGADTNVLVVSDHGWNYEPGPEFGHNHGPPGVIVMRGPGVLGNGLPAGAQPTVLDVAPTVLALYGLPPSREFAGRVLREAFEPSAVAQAEREPLASWGTYRPKWPSQGGAGEAESRREGAALLRHLGYLE